MRSGTAVPRRPLTIPALISLAVLCVTANAAAVQILDEHAAAPGVQFNRDIRPLLADRCLKTLGTCTT